MFFVSAAIVHIVLYSKHISFENAQNNLWLLNNIKGIEFTQYYTFIYNHEPIWSLLYDNVYYILLFSI